MPTSKPNSESEGRRKLLKKLSSLFNKFDRNELRTVVLPFFGKCITWNDVRDGLLHKKLALNSHNISKYVDEILKKKNVSNKVIGEIILNLSLIDVSRHSSNRLWHTYEMKDQDLERTAVAFSDDNEFKTLINSSLPRNSSNIIIDVSNHNEIYFVIMTEGSVSNAKSISSVSTVFAVKENQNHFFCTRKSNNAKLINILTHALGYESCKPVKLYGKHLSTLFALLENRKNQLIFNEIEDVPEENDPVVKDSGIDFSQYGTRKNYAEKRMGGTELNLESIKFTCTNAQVEHPEDSPLEDVDLSDLQMTVSWELRSKNVFEMIPHLAENFQLQHPTPDYLINFMKMGRNNVKYTH